MNIADLTLAYELHCEGCAWGLIARYLGVEVRTLKWSVYNSMENGISNIGRKSHAPAIPDAAVKAANLMRSQGLGWSSIATHLGHDRERLRIECKRRYRAER